MDDNSLMPTGSYKNVKLIDVPADYLLKIYKEKKESKELQDYIEENLDALKIEIKNNAKVKKEKTKKLVAKLDDFEEEEFFDYDEEEIEEESEFAVDEDLEDLIEESIENDLDDDEFED